MKLSDVVSAMHLPVFAEVPLLVFMGIFLGVAAYLLSRREHFDEMANIPLREERVRRNQP